MCESPTMEMELLSSLPERNKNNTLSNRTIRTETWNNYIPIHGEYGE
jgi:hypothetical protein